MRRERSSATARSARLGRAGTGVGALPALRSQVNALALCVAVGALCAWIKTPIPWMIGPLFVMALARWRAVNVEAPGGFRNGGQWLMGTDDWYAASWEQNGSLTRNNGANYVQTTSEPAAVADDRTIR